MDPFTERFAAYVAWRTRKSEVTEVDRVMRADEANPDEMDPPADFDGVVIESDPYI